MRICRLSFRSQFYGYLAHFGEPCEVPAALGRKLKSRGHEVVFIGVPDAEPAVRARHQFARRIPHNFETMQLEQLFMGELI